MKDFVFVFFLTWRSWSERWSEAVLIKIIMRVHSREWRIFSFIKKASRAVSSFFIYAKCSTTQRGNGDGTTQLT